VGITGAVAAPGRREYVGRCRKRLGLAGFGSLFLVSRRGGDSSCKPVLYRHADAAMKPVRPARGPAQVAMDNFARRPLSYPLPWEPVRRRA
jgi:hypothetical protein